MGRAFPADGFVFAVSTGIQPPVGIDDQIRAVPAERSFFMDLPAVITNHELDRSLFRFDGSHGFRI